MDQDAPTFGATLDKAPVAQALGLSPDDILAPPQVVSTGLPFCVTLLRDRATVSRARLDPEGLRALAAHTGATGPDMIEPYMITRQGATDAGDTFARLLLAPPGPSEDPFTGSATGAAAAWLWHHQMIDRPVYTAEQGHDMGRPGQARVEVLGPPEAITGVRVTGRAHVLMSGTLHL